jgi:hypothetical protein
MEIYSKVTVNFFQVNSEMPINDNLIISALILTSWHHDLKFSEDDWCVNFLPLDDIIVVVSMLRVEKRSFLRRHIHDSTQTNTACE